MTTDGISTLYLEPLMSRRRAEAWLIHLQQHLAAGDQRDREKYAQFRDAVAALPLEI
jgi:hypothetical protein